MRTTLCLLLTITVVSSFPNFQTLIPNGRKVPNPCSATGGVWPGVGHLRVTGSGPTNPFGEASLGYVSLHICKIKQLEVNHMSVVYAFCIYRKYV